MFRKHRFPPSALTFIRIHHDIKTDNILVKFNVNTSHLTGSPPDYNISLKLADLGLTDIMSFDEEKMTAIGDKPGTQTYSKAKNPLI